MALLTFCNSLRLAAGAVYNAACGVRFHRRLPPQPVDPLLAPLEKGQELPLRSHRDARVRAPRGSDRCVAAEDALVELRRTRSSCENRPIRGRAAGVIEPAIPIHRVQGTTALPPQVA